VITSGQNSLVSKEKGKLSIAHIEKSIGIKSIVEAIPNLFFAEQEPFSKMMNFYFYK